MSLMVTAGCLSVPVAPARPEADFTLPATLRVQFVERGVTVVRDVPLEDYVRATAISEFAPPAGDLDVVEQMLEVQAIISRTYAVAHLGRHARDGFDLCSTTHCQLFEPGRVRTSRWSAAAAEAVAHTPGMVLRFDGRPAQALFHADCGGHTSAPTDVWGGDSRSYLVAQADDGLAAETHMTWQYRADAEAIAHALNADDRTHLTGRLEDIDVVTRDDAGRAERVAITSRRDNRTSATSVVMRGDDLRQVLSRAFGPRAVRSTWFDVARTGTTYTFTGRGYGHGVGLCQAGALARLQAGARPAEVIARYYPGTTLATPRAPAINWSSRTRPR